MAARAPHPAVNSPSRRGVEGVGSDPLALLAGEIERALEAALGRMTGAERMLEACRYAVLGQGKRVRPGLVLLSFEAAGGGSGSGAGAAREQAMVAAVAVEFVHTFSLVHDDLPCMDDDDLRRGRPTLHIAMGECSAVLAGDLLLTEAMTMLVRDLPDPQLGAQLAAELGQATARMISGQSWDTEGAGGAEGLDMLRRIHEHKTGALIRASCRMGGICASASASALEALTRYGEALGLLFQITDDLLDVEQSAETIGKSAGKDAAAGKLTYPGALGIAGARAEARRLQAEAERAAGELGPIRSSVPSPPSPLAAFAALVAARTR
jgi:geranylgeranyl diphosphate synthase, type II